MKTASLLFSSLLLSLCSLYAQTPLDSLRSAAFNEEIPAESRIEAMYSLGHHYISSQPDSALFFAEQQLSLAKSLGDKAAEVRALHVRSTYHMRKYEFNKALTILREALTLSKMTDDSLFIGKFLNQFGGTYLSIGEIDSALYYYKLAIPLYERTGDQQGLAAVLGGLGIVSKERSEFEQALAYYEQAIQIFEEAGVERGIALMSKNIAFIYITRNDYAKSLEYCQRSYDIFEALEDKSEMAGMLDNMALTYVYMKDYGKALTYQNRSKKIHEAEENKMGLANAYQNLGLIYDNFGNSALALKNYEQSLHIRESIGHKAGVAMVLSNIGKIYFDQHDNEQALVHYAQALKRFEEIGNELKKTLVLRDMANAYHQIGNDSLALRFVMKSLKISRQINVKNSEVNNLIALGNIYTDMGRVKEAKEAFQEGLNIAREIGEEGLQGNALLGLGQLAINDQEWTQANIYAQQSLTIAQKIQSILSIRNASNILWQSYEALGQKGKAFDNYKLFITMRDSIVNEESQRATIRYEFKQKALADSLQSASVLNIQIEENKRRKTISYFLIFGLGITLILGLLLFNRFRLAQRQRNIIETEKGKLDKAYSELNNANEKLKELDNFKSQFFTNISHEFRTPLTIITGMAQQIQKEPERFLEKGLSLITRNGNHLLQLINQILDLRKLESGKLNLNQTQADVMKFMRVCFASFESMAESKDIELSFLSDETERVMDFDPEKLRLIINNLLSNAIKFTQEGGKVSLQVYSNKKKQLVIQVRDTGMGIPSEKIPFIFSRFYQIDRSDTRVGEGTGIGLSLAKELVQFMEGEISVESVVGQGTSFTVVLPITQQAPLVDAQPVLQTGFPILSAIVPTTPNGIEELPRLLIIEDNPDIVSYLYHLLEDQYALSSAPDGEAGIKAALEQVPDLIITDVMMPNKNGYEVTETLKLDERTSHIPIVMLTAKADHDSRMEGYKRGADAYLAKPFNQEELFIRLQKLLQIRQTLRERYQDGNIPSQNQTEDPNIEIEDAFLLKARESILNHIDDSNYRGESLGKDLAMSRSNLHRKIKALTGLSSSHFIRTVRIDHAKELMGDSDLQLSEVAYSTGFTNPAYFNRVFKEVVGNSPSDWREKNNKGD